MKQKVMMDIFFKKKETGLPDFCNGRVKSFMDPLPSELTTSQVRKDRNLSMKQATRTHHSAQGPE